MEDIITIHSGDRVYKAIKITGFSISGDDYCVIGVPSDDKKFTLLCMKVVNGNLEEIKDEKIKILTDKVLEGLITSLKKEEKINGR